jgi:dihydrofolate reductase
MSRVVVTEFVTVDGVMEDPGGADRFERGGWAFRFARDQEADRYKLEEVMRAGAMLLGRVTYEGFAAAWPGRTDDVGFADKMNSMPKYVVSQTLRKPAWNNTTVIRGDLAGAVDEVKARHGDDILVAGSATLVRDLTERQLVDEYRLLVFPVLLGAGTRLFPDGGDTIPLRLVEQRTFGAGIILLTYHPAD